MSVTAQIVTAEQLLELQDDSFRYDLVRGELDKMSPAGSRHGIIAGTAYFILRDHVRPRQLGLVFAAETGFLLAKKPDTVLGPDVSFVRAARIPVTGVPDGYWPGPPDLAIEVVSPSQSLQKIERKALEYLAAGTAAVVVLHPKYETARVYRPGAPVIELQKQDTLDLDFVVPGLSIAVAGIFA
jgi:Uma2 family endonuclease